MAAKKETNNSTNDVMGSYFKDWWGNDSIFEELEQRTLQAFENQKEWIEGTRDQLEQLEEYSKKMTTEWKTNTQSVFENYSKQLGVQDYQEWLNKLEEIGHKSQTIASLPGKASLDLYSRSTEQLHEASVHAIAQNKKVREKSINAFEGMFDHLRNTQPQMFKFFDFYASSTK
ncbi:hypothetical protein N0O92_07885 [Alkalihalobacillus sp. MEB130]|uniref:hypothetical protein n=1 Tax=Alkalihalobacillus sp. MEB130 TaxID=2976704 RepID=UPI0028DF98FD|nr:hypothetical protein [Alkalihalobacillus sp. MEB130]MDT8860151.1 hypothetical protein [Alkalihalobacillus sp. MEB130]